MCSDYIILPDKGFIMTYFSATEYNLPYKTHLVKVNSIGEITTEITISNPDGDCILHNLLLLQNGDIVGIGEWKHPNENSEIWYIGIDTSLSIKWEKKYLINANWIAKIRSFINNEGNIISGAQISSMQSIFNSRLFFLETSSVGDTIKTKYQNANGFYPIFDFFKQGEYYNNTPLNFKRQFYRN
jgi:hypothetical protein